MRVQGICRQCQIGLGTVRYSSTSAKAAKLSRKSVLEVSGPDAQKFLKGLTCKDVEPLGGGYSGFMNATGRILHTVFIFPVGSDRYLITHESPPDHPAPLQKYLVPFRLRSKVRFKDVSDEWDAWGVWDTIPEPQPERKWKYGSGGASEATWSWPNGIGDLGLRDKELGCWDLRTGRGKQLLLPKGSECELVARMAELIVADASIRSQSEYDLNRMRLGVPEGPQEVVPGSALPLESCMDIHGGLDVRKGCYVGQELTVRTYHTGATRKRILPIQLFPLQPEYPLPREISVPEKLAPNTFGDILYHPPSSSTTRKAKSAGRILSLHDMYGSVGLGLLRLEMVERTWWSPQIAAAATVGEWTGNGSARLTTIMGGVEYGVFVGKGEAYASALENMS